MAGPAVAADRPLGRPGEGAAVIAGRRLVTWSALMLCQCSLHALILLDLRLCSHEQVLCAIAATHCRIFPRRAHGPRLRRATSRSCARSTTASWQSTRCATATGRSTPTPSSATARRRRPRLCLSAAWPRSAARLTCGATMLRAARPLARRPTKCAGERAALACRAQSVFALDRPPHPEPAFALVERLALCPPGRQRLRCHTVQVSMSRNFLVLSTPPLLVFLGCRALPGRRRPGH